MSNLEPIDLLPQLHSHKVDIGLLHVASVSSCGCLGILIMWQVASPRMSKPRDQGGYCNTPRFRITNHHLHPVVVCLLQEPALIQSRRELHKRVNTERWRLGAILEAGWYRFYIRWTLYVFKFPEYYHCDVLVLKRNVLRYLSWNIKMWASNSLSNGWAQVIINKNNWKHPIGASLVAQW